MYLRKQPVKPWKAFMLAALTWVLAFPLIFRAIPWVLSLSKVFGVTYSHGAVTFRAWSGAILISTIAAMFVYLWRRDQ